MSDLRFSDKWRWVKLGEIILDTRNGLYKPDEFYGSGVPILKMFNIGRLDGSWNLERVDRIKLSAAEHEMYRLKQGDILINRVNSRELVGKCAVINFLTEDAVFESKNIRLRLDPHHAFSKYVATWFNSVECRRQIDTRLKQIVGQATISRTDLDSLELQLPSLEEQHRIMEIIEAHMAAVEQARSAAQAQLDAAEGLMAAYLREVFEGDEAREWERIQLKFLGKPQENDVVQTGPFGAQLPSSEFVSEGIPVLNVGNVQRGYLNLEKLNFVSEQKANALARYKLLAGDLLFTRSGSVGRSAIVPNEAEGWLMSYHLLRVRFDQTRVNPHFVSSAIQGSEDVISQVRLAAGRGATRDGVNTSILGNLLIPLPTNRKTQDEIVAVLNVYSDKVRATLRDMHKLIKLIDDMPAAILRLAFSGEL